MASAPPPPALTEAQFHDSRGMTVNIIAWVFTGIAIATVFLKLFARSQITKRLGWDDFFIFLSLALSIIAAAFVSYSVTLGLGRHTAAVIADHGADGVVLTAKWQILGFPFNIGAFSFPNISIAILIVHLLDRYPLRTNLLYGMVTVQVVIALVSVVLIFVQCTPVEMLWNPNTPNAKCWDPAVFNNFNYFVSAYTTVTDIVLAVVPISVFWKLQMPFSTKLGVCIMMGLTLLSAIVTIVKATYLHLFTDRTDPLWNVVPLVIWGLIEQNVVLVAACIPTLRPFFHKATFRSANSRSGTDNSRSRSGSRFKLSSNPKGRASSVSELALREDAKYETRAKGYDAESNNSQQGIWRTMEVDISSGKERDSERGENRKFRDIVPSSLRT
ncbi:hypothetical protein P152DRAFT_280903 [Eremomyces bilateralis CBS 781.70]|uniref:Rhodopsin domain-containing protein n=1 Tax=Eremomyces bilateralis CBS 781.70 TaxID=1392243 RepID=A0A6G1G941_9PEZI|nr:uncharacterized protein P152DRAFT_280903 [Eremomyces bilateralis CBS 781.70]KAF1814598.1 hypothetical protein P152DRAFT_280903 [Eremomyces bilateralis CBS 781.70]